MLCAGGLYKDNGRKKGPFVLLLLAFTLQLILLLSGIRACFFGILALAVADWQIRWEFCFNPSRGQIGEYTAVKMNRLVEDCPDLVAQVLTHVNALLGHQNLSESGALRSTPAFHTPHFLMMC
ncbi:hypothetical protein EWB00_000797 [Schistosoma japonicum]|uniref:Uncharacterized protein n=1 Tax=Schistosoma japonicum TaxID=6182 RepID=A0A4Z2CKD0_SCHJA|nr:hypothetical protein EWB00_000797 [Schistosoma japonicum]